MLFDILHLKIYVLLLMIIWDAGVLTSDEQLRDRGEDPQTPPHPPQGI